jgi:hypothetical protein
MNAVQTCAAPLFPIATAWNMVLWLTVKVLLPVGEYVTAIGLLVTSPKKTREFALAVFQLTVTGVGTFNGTVTGAIVSEQSTV